MLRERASVHAVHWWLCTQERAGLLLSDLSQTAWHNQRRHRCRNLLRIQVARYASSSRQNRRYPSSRVFGLPATSVAKDLCVSAIFWTIGVIITEVPFAKHACGIAIVLEDLTHGDFVFA